MGRSYWRRVCRAEHIPELSMSGDIMRFRESIAYPFEAGEAGGGGPEATVAAGADALTAAAGTNTLAAAAGTETSAAAAGTNAFAAAG